VISASETDILNKDNYNFLYIQITLNKNHEQFYGELFSKRRGVIDECILSELILAKGLFEYSETDIVNQMQQASSSSRWWLFSCCMDRKGPQGWCAFFFRVGKEHV
jgi:hypothetical protein